MKLLKYFNKTICEFSAAIYSSAHVLAAWLLGISDEVWGSVFSVEWISVQVVRRGLKKKIMFWHIKK